MSSCGTLCVFVQLACAILFLTSNDVICSSGKSDTGTEEHAYRAARPPAPQTPDGMWFIGRYEVRHKKHCLKHTWILKNKQINKATEKKEQILPIFEERTQERDVTKAFPLDFLLAGQSFPQLEVITVLLFSFFSCFFSPCLLLKGIAGCFRTGGGSRVKTAAFGHGIYALLVLVCVCTCLRVFKKIFDSGTPSQGRWRQKLQCNCNLLQRLFWCVIVLWSEKMFVQKRAREWVRMGWTQHKPCFYK